MNSDIICVFGGTFNPVHTGHIEIARHVHSQFNLDKILIIRVIPFIYRKQ